MTENFILWELQRIHESLTKTKEEHTHNFRMITPTEKFNFCEPILNTTKIGSFRLSVYKSVFNVNRRNNQFLYASKVMEDSPAREPASPTAGRLSSNTISNIKTNNNSSTNSNTSSNSNTNTDKEIAKHPAMAEPLISRISPDSKNTSVLNYNYKGITLLYSTITPGAYELTDIAELIKEETDSNVI